MATTDADRDPPPKRARPMNDIATMANMVLKQGFIHVNDNNNNNLKQILEEAVEKAEARDVAVVVAALASQSETRKEVLSFLYETMFVERLMDMMSTSPSLKQSIGLLLPDMESFPDVNENKSDTYRRLELLYRAYFNVKKQVLTNQGAAMEALGKLDVDMLTTVLKEANSIPNTTLVPIAEPTRLLRLRAKRDFAPRSPHHANILPHLTITANPILAAPSLSRLIRRLAHNALVYLWKDVTQGTTLLLENTWSIIENHLTAISWSSKTSSLQNIPLSWLSHPILIRLSGDAADDCLMLITDPRTNGKVKYTDSSCTIEHLHASPVAAWSLTRPWHHILAQQVQFAEQHGNMRLASFCEDAAMGVGTTTATKPHEIVIDFGPVFERGVSQLTQCFGDKIVTTGSDGTSTDGIHFKVKFINDEAVSATCLPYSGSGRPLSMTVNQIHALKFVLSSSSPLVIINGGPKAGKTTLAVQLVSSIVHTSGANSNNGAILVVCQTKSDVNICSTMLRGVLGGNSHVTTLNEAETTMVAEEALRAGQAALRTVLEWATVAQSPDPENDAASYASALLFLDAMESHWRVTDTNKYEASRRIRRQLEKVRPFELLKSNTRERRRRMAEFVWGVRARVIVATVDDLVKGRDSLKAASFSHDLLVFDGDVSQWEFIVATNTVGIDLKRVVMIGEGTSKFTHMLSTLAVFPIFELSNERLGHDQMMIPWSLSTTVQVVNVPEFSSNVWTGLDAQFENVGEAEFCVAHFALLVLHGVAAGDILIYTTQAKQRDLMWRIIKARCPITMGMPRIELINDDDDDGVKSKAEYVLASLVRRKKTETNHVDDETILNTMKANVRRGLVVYCRENAWQYPHTSSRGVKLRIGERWGSPRRSGIEYEVMNCSTMMGFVSTLMSVS